MSGISRIVVDSVLDRRRVRIIVSAKGRKPEVHIVSKRALARLLNRRRLHNHPESRVFTIAAPLARITSFLKEADVSGVRLADVPTVVPTAPDIAKAKEVTKDERKRIRAIHRRLHERTRRV